MQCKNVVQKSEQELTFGGQTLTRCIRKICILLNLMTEVHMMEAHEKAQRLPLDPFSRTLPAGNLGCLFGVGCRS